MEKVGQLGDLHIIMPQNHRDSTPNLYKQCTVPLDQIKEDERSRETEKGPVQNPSKNSPRISGEVKISLELRVRSKSRDEQIFFIKITKKR